jgi:hypothetical protein
MTTPEVAQKPVEIFISYSRKDLVFLQELRASLKVFENEHGVRIWSDGNLTPGVEWEEELYAQFNAAHIILLLVSPNFFSSDYCYHRELPAALKRHDEGTARVIPVIIQSVPWKYARLARLMVLPKEGRPVELWEHRNEAYENIGESLYALFDEIAHEMAPHDSSAVTLPEILPPADPAQPAPTKGAWRDVAAPAGTAANHKSSAADSSPLIVPPLTDSPTTTNMPVLPATPRAAVSDSPAATRRFVVPEVCLCLLTPGRREKLQTLRKWCREPQDPLFAGPAARLVECPSLDEALTRIRQRPQETILLLDGFEPGAPQLEEVVRPAGDTPRLEVIINSPEWEQFAAQRASASILQTVRTVTDDKMLIECLRKALLRVRTRQLATARVIRTKSEFADYFALRYTVWNSLGYLASHKISTDPAWELDYTDRMSLPFGLFAKADGKLLGAARLVRGFGEEYPQHVQVIGEMLREQGAELLERNFQYPANRPQLPFDVLQEFKDFQTYYHKLVRRGVAKAEVSRVIVDPAWQRLGLGEVIVDTLCSFGRAHSFQVLFLACHSKHAEFYRRCGFSAIPGVTGDHFLTYKVPCLAMERELFAAGELAG